MDEEINNKVAIANNVDYQTSKGIIGKKEMSTVVRI